MKERIAGLAVAAALALAGIWLAFAAASGGTAANAGRVQFYPGPVCRFSPAGPRAEGCPRPPTARRAAETRR